MVVLLQTKTKQNTMNNMKNTNPIFSLKNFRSFGEEGADFELAPITVLTGCNSAGKSSLVKAQLLLKDFLSQINSQSGNLVNILKRTYFHISDKELALGNYGKLINKKNTDGKIKLSYTTHSNYLAEDVRVIVEFIENKDNVLGDGIPFSLRIEKIDGSIIYNNPNIQESKPGDLGNDNYLSIVDNFRRFVVFCAYIEKDCDYDFYGKTTKEDLNKSKDLYNEQKFSKGTLKGFERIQLLEKIPSSETINQWLTNGSFFYYLPLFKEVEGKNIKSVRKYLMKKYEENIGIWGNPEKLLDWISFFCEDIESSNYSSFRDYFDAKESEALKEGSLQKYPYMEWDLDHIWDEKNAVEIFGLDENSSVPKENSNVNKNIPNEVINRLTREGYEDIWNLRAVVDVLEMICFDGVSRDFDVYRSNRYNTPMPSGCRYFLTNIEKFHDAVCTECLTPLFLREVKYVNSSSVAINRLYSVDDTDKIGKCLNLYLKGNQQIIEYNNHLSYKGLKKYIPGLFMNKWISKLGIGDYIEIKGTDEGLGILAFLEKEGEKRLLADEGYGITQLVALLMQIENNILNATQIHYFVGRYSPTPFEYMPSTIYVEEPEIHLHPKYQSLLADMFVEAYREYNIHFIIETHSEYLIRKLQVMVADKEFDLTTNDVSLNYVEKDRNGISTNRKIEILEDGRLSGTFGSGFFDEADSLAMNLMKYKIRK